jgi:hypothetical protein
LLEYNGDLADRVVGVAANAGIAFKPCQKSSAVQKALDEENEAIEVDFPSFLCLLSRMAQMIDGHITISRSRIDRQTILDVRVVDSSFVFVETNNEALLQAFESRLSGALRSEAPAPG